MQLYLCSFSKKYSILKEYDKSHLAFTFVFVLFLALVEFKNVAYSQDVLSTDSIRLYAPNELRYDFQQMRYALETIHCSLYEFTNKPTMDNYLDSLYSRLNHPMSEIDFYKYVLRIAAKISSGHTSTWPTSNVVHKSLPLHLLFIDNKIYTSRNMSGNNTIPDGSRIVSINSLSDENIIKQLIAVTPGDGYIQIGRLRLIQRFYFDFLYSLFIGQPSDYRIEFIPFGKKTKQVVTLAALDKKAIEQNYKIRYGSKPYPLSADTIAVKIDYDEKNSIAILHVKRFFTTGQEPRDYFETQFERIFTTIQKHNIKNLIIDVRENGGGDNKKVALLCSYLIDSSFVINKVESAS